MGFAEAESSMASSGGDRVCTFNHQCFCRCETIWCSPRIPRVAPGRDYEWMPAAAAADDDDCAPWSLLVGFMSVISPSNTFFLRLHRFHVARSGRVLSRSSDAVEVIGDVDYDSKTDASSQVTVVTATPGTDGSSSLCLFCKETCFVDLKRIVPPRPLQLDLNLTGGGSKKIAVSRLSPLPGLPPELGPGMPTRPISAAGDLWAPYLTKHYGPCRLVMLRLDKDVGQWVEVAAIDLAQERETPSFLTGRVLNGYAVVGDGGRTTILLSLNPRMQPDHPFFAFDCSTHTLASVVTDHRCRPIHGRGVYVQEDDTIYSLGGSCIICAHKLCQEEGEYRMAEPVKVDCVCPFNKDEGYGFLTHLGGRVMCAVWISVDMSCTCDAFHVVISTFRVEGSSGGNREGPFVPKGVQVLHSTCRQLDMFPCKPTDYSEFCFLQ